MRTRGAIVFTALVVTGTIAPVQAEWLVTPYLGINLAGDAEFRRGGPGGTVGYLGRRLGFEFEAQRYHHFFKDKNVDVIPNNCAPGGPPSCIDLNTDAWSFMGNVVVPLGAHEAKWRPYGAAGLGVIHPWIEGPGDQYDVGQDDLAVNVGGGLMYVLGGRVALRGDVRYFRAFVDEAKREGAYFRDYGFVRATVGVTFRFAR